jgi:hypothetical protein
MSLLIIIAIVLAYMLGVYLLNSWLDYRKNKKFSFEELRECLVEAVLNQFLWGAK